MQISSTYELDDRSMLYFLKKSLAAGVNVIVMLYNVKVSNIQSMSPKLN